MQQAAPRACRLPALSPSARRRVAQDASPLTPRQLVERVPDILKLTPRSELAASLQPHLPLLTPRGQQASSSGAEDRESAPPDAGDPLVPPPYLADLGLFSGDKNWLFYRGRKKVVGATSNNSEVRLANPAPTNAMVSVSPRSVSDWQWDADLHKRIGQIPWFVNMPDAEVRNLLRRSSHRLAPRWTSVIREGCSGNTFYVLLSGSVQCTSMRGVDVTLHAGASFGEGALLTRIRREATVTTNEPAHLLQIVAADLQGLTVEWEALRLHVIAQMLQKVRFFAPLTRDKRMRAGRLMQIEYFVPNGVVFEQGDVGDKFYIVNEGRIGIFLGQLKEEQMLTSKQTKHKTGKGLWSKPSSAVASQEGLDSLFSLAVKHSCLHHENMLGEFDGADPYPWFGESALLSGNGAVRGATAIALEPTKLLSLSHRAFPEFMREFPSFADVFNVSTSGYAAINKLKSQKAALHY